MLKIIWKRIDVMLFRLKSNFERNKNWYEVIQDSLYLNKYILLVYKKEKNNTIQQYNYKTNNWCVKWPGFDKGHEIAIYMTSIVLPHILNYTERKYKLTEK